MDKFRPINRSKRPGRLVLIVLTVFALIWVLLNPKDTLERVRGFMPGTSSSSIKGEWVGHIDIYGIQDPWHRALSKPAVIRFELGPPGYFLGNHGGTGEISIAGQPPRAFRIQALSISAKDPTREFRTSLWLDSYHPNDPNDLVSGGFHGQWKPGESLSIERDLFTGYSMKGLLVKGTDDDYNSLVQVMNAAVGAKP
ncbi:hypothetical protein [Paraburkholderia megapolitana]|uniref:Uncharacterized protein n=1 Tax=Paraburkholderia megapolitana TaxID=420953 RepID=A0A1I3NYV0_9BURK|nr:hypothetical protein [Paraburkholderia megapolitana]QDQ84542.1 hypothetical protein FNZ07_26035 [Paraburkholderia megapolitana]SFJ14465.1 hypothetical protein SAMN05192543_105568 [Paraburkholderia megapolitana]